MYAWLWHRLPGGWPGRLLGSLVLTGGVVALLLLVVFPRVERVLPFQRVTVDSPGSASVTVSPSPAK